MSQFSNYFQQISQIAAKGNATEHTYRPALKTLLESLAPGIVATNEPKRIKCGAPDYILTHGETPLGYVEAKDVGEPLEKIEKTDQMRRYLESLGNLILTDYVEFRWYVGGQHRLTARLGTGGGKKPLTAGLKGEAEIKALLNAFLETTAPTVSGPKELAGRMANLAKLVRDTISRALGDEDKGGTLHQQFEGFRKVLLHDLTPEQFADMSRKPSLTACSPPDATASPASGSRAFSPRISCPKQTHSCGKPSATLLGRIWMSGLSGSWTIWPNCLTGPTWRPFSKISGIGHARKTRLFTFTRRF